MVSMRNGIFYFTIFLVGVIVTVLQVYKSSCITDGSSFYCVTTHLKL